MVKKTLNIKNNKILYELKEVTKGGVFKMGFRYFISLEKPSLIKGQKITDQILFKTKPTIEEIKKRVIKKNFINFDYIRLTNKLAKLENKTIKRMSK